MRHQDHMLNLKLFAFFQHGFQLARSYKLNFGARYVAAFVAVLFYFFLAKLFQRTGVVVAPGVDYFTFVLIGGAFSKYVEIAMRTLADTLREEMLLGTIEPLLSTATPTTLALIGPSLFIISEGTLLVSAQLIMGFVFGADFGRANWLSAGVLTLLLIVCLSCWGIISAALTLRYKRRDPINWTIGAISYVFSGVFFPITALPPALQIISAALPFTYGLHGLRGALLNGSTVIDLWPDVLALLIFTAVLLPCAIIFLRRTTRYLKQSGAIGEY